MRDYCVKCDVETVITFYQEDGNGYIIEYTCPECRESQSYYEF